MTYTSHLPDIKRRMAEARNAGLTASGGVVADAVKDGLRGGFTSGDFDTGKSVEEVKQLPPEETPDGACVRVGTNLVYNLLWEIGHVSVFSKKFERKEVWLPALTSTRDQQLAAFQRAYRGVFGT